MNGTAARDGTPRRKASPMSPRQPHLRIEKDQDLTRVSLSTHDLTESNLQELGEQLNAIADGIDGGRLEVNLGEVRYLTSTALGKFIGLHKRLRERGGRLVLADVD